MRGGAGATGGEGYALGIETEGWTSRLEGGVQAVEYSPEVALDVVVEMVEGFGGNGGHLVGVSA